MFPSLEKVLAPSPVFPALPGTEEKQSRINVTVVFTSVPSTLAALKKAGTLANQLRAVSHSSSRRWVPIPTR